MDPTLAFGRWDALNAVPASLVVELCQIVAVDFEMGLSVTDVQQAGSSADALRVLDVGRSQVGYEQL